MGNQSFFQFGVKNYDNQWFLKYGLSYKEAAVLLKEWGVSFVLTAHSALSMPDSAVESEVGAAEAEKFEGYEDRAFRDALAEAGIEYWVSFCMLFDPPAVEADPSLRPIGSDGEPMEQQDWYLGIPPTAEGYIARKTAQIKAAAKESAANGVHLQFMRWPGFWELWLPESRRADFPEYSYDPVTLARFRRETGIAVPAGAAEAAAWIDANVRKEWTDWKCEKVTDVVRGVRAVLEPEVRLMLNTVPFGVADFEWAQEHVFGQRLSELREVIDVFEVMTYHQILKRPLEWIPQIGTEMKARTGRTTVCTLQVRPLYLEGMHAKEGRAAEITAAEFVQAAAGAAGAGMDGVVAFVWSDLLEMVLGAREMWRVEGVKRMVEMRRWG